MIYHFDAHRVIGLICRYPKHKWRFRVWQILYIREHTSKCYECQERMAALDKKHPQVGRQSELN